VGQNLSKAVWRHNTTVSRATNRTPFRFLFRAEEVQSEEIKHQSLRIATEASPCPIKVEDKDSVELDRLKAVANLQKYQ
jgi:hypothetical protein